MTQDGGVQGGGKPRPYRNPSPAILRIATNAVATRLIPSALAPVPPRLAGTDGMIPSLLKPKNRKITHQ